MTDRRAEVLLDIRGHICPSTLLKTLKEINSHREALRKGEVRIVVLTSNRNATSTIPNAAADMGYNAGVSKVDDYFRIEIDGDA